jgi:hypothetical protein
MEDLLPSPEAGRKREHADIAQALRGQQHRRGLAECVKFGIAGLST